MSGKPPPKKKSRFLAGSKNAMDNLLHPLKKKLRQDGEDPAGANGNGPSRSNPSAQTGPPLLANIPSFAPLTIPRQAAASSQYPAASASHAPHPFLPGPSHSLAVDTNALPLRSQRDTRRPGQKSSLQAQDPDSEVETEVEASSDEGEDEEYNESDEENKKPVTQDESVIKRERRKGIHGIEVLLPPSQDTDGQASNGSGFQYPGSMVMPQYPFGGQSLQGPNSTAISQHLYAGQVHPYQNFLPPGNTYTFGGVPTNPYVNAAGGQHPFNFRPAQGAFIPGMTQQQTYNTCLHPIGSGLARMAQQGAHTDTGPLSQRQPQTPTTPNQPIPVVTPGAPLVDVDRDEQGRRLQIRAPRPAAHHGVRQIVPKPAPRLTNIPALVPDHMYTCPNYVAHAQEYARKNLKRKRPDTILPPASYVYQHTGSPTFNIFDGILLYPELCFALAAHLPVKDLLSLYAISKDFHVILDTRFTTVMLSQATRKAPESARTYPFRSYAHLCRSDPAARIPHPNTQLAAQGKPRRIPSFRWLRMVLHREKTIHELLTVFAEDGIPLPARCSLALKRLWFMLDIPDNARRIGFMHNPRNLNDIDLYFCACFFTKMDMRLNDPVSGEKRDGMRKLLLAQRSFTTILRVVKRELWTTRFEILREWIRLKHEVVAADEVGLDMFGVPSEQIGKGRLEYWGVRSEKEVGRRLAALLRPDQLVIREAFKRGMRFDKHYLRFLLYGYVRPDTLEDYAPRTYGRRIDEIKDDEYEVDDMVGGVAALMVNDNGFDPLLDLGTPRNVSAYTIVKEKTGKAEMKMRTRDEQFLDKCVEWWDEERRGLRQGEN